AEDQRADEGDTGDLHRDPQAGEELRDVLLDKYGHRASRIVTGPPLRYGPRRRRSRTLQAGVSGLWRLGNIGNDGGLPDRHGPQLLPEPLLLDRAQELVDEFHRRLVALVHPDAVQIRIAERLPDDL